MLLVLDFEDVLHLIHDDSRPDMHRIQAKVIRSGANPLQLWPGVVCRLSTHRHILTQGAKIQLKGNCDFSLQNVQWKINFIAGL